MASTDELLLRVKVDAETGKLELVNSDLQKLKDRSATAGTEVGKLEKKVMQASIAFERKQKAIRNVNDSIIKSSSLFNAFGGTLGQVSGHIFDVSNQLEDLEFASRKAGDNFNAMTATVQQATDKMGVLGVGALAVSAAFVGWKLGTFINENLRLGEVIQSNAEKMAAMSKNTEQAGESWKDILINSVLPFKPAIEAATAAGILLSQQVKQSAVNTDELGVALQKLHAENALRFQAEQARELKQALDEDIAATQAQAREIKVEAGLSAQQLAARRKNQEIMARVQYELARGTDEEKKAEQGLKNAILETARAEAAVISSNLRRKDSTEKVKKAVADLTAQYTALAAAMASAASGASISMTLEAKAIGGAVDAAKEMAIASLDAARGVTSLGEAALDAARGIKELTAAEQANALAAGAAAGGADGMKSKLQGIVGTLGDVSSITGQVLSSFGGINQTFDDIVGAFQGGATAAMGFAQIMSGDVVDGIKNVIAGIGQLFKALKDLFGHNWGKDVQTQLNAFLPGLKISDDLMKRITEDAKKMGNAMAAVFLNLKAIMDDVGVSASNVGTFISELRNGFSLLADGVITDTQLIGVLNDTFDDLAKASMNSSGIISNAMREIIDLAHQAGLEVQAIADFVTGQLTAGFQGFDAVFQRWFDKMSSMKAPQIVPGRTDFVGDPTKGQFEHFSKLITMWIDNMLASGMSIDQVMQLAGGDLDHLAEIAKKFGFSLSPALKSMIALRAETEKWGPVLGGVQAQLVAMANAVGMTQATFNEIVKDAKSPFKDVLKDGKLTKAEFQAILPLLLTMIQLSQQFGLKLPKWVQDIIGKAQNKHWLPKDLDVNVNAHYKKIDADTLHVKNLQVSGATSGGTTGGGAGGGGNLRGGGATGGGATGGGNRSQPVQLQSNTTVVLNLPRAGQKEIAKVVAHMISSGEVPLDLTGQWIPLIKR